MKKKNYTGQALRTWARECGFESQEKAAMALGVPHRTYARWISTGIPGARSSSLVYREFITDRMAEILVDRKKSSAKS